jgi:hypothetical protein
VRARRVRAFDSEEQKRPLANVSIRGKDVSNEDVPQGVGLGQVGNRGVAKKKAIALSGLGHVTVTKAPLHVSAPSVLCWTGRPTL